jgi:hypothetical protein
MAADAQQALLKWTNAMKEQVVAMQAVYSPQEIEEMDFEDKDIQAIRLLSSLLEGQDEPLSPLSLQAGETPDVSSMNPVIGTFYQFPFLAVFDEPLNSVPLVESPQANAMEVLTRAFESGPWNESSAESSSDPEGKYVRDVALPGAIQAGITTRYNSTLDQLRIVNVADVNKTIQMLEDQWRDNSGDLGGSVGDLDEWDDFQNRFVQPALNWLLGIQKEIDNSWVGRATLQYMGDNTNGVRTRQLAVRPPPDKPGYLPTDDGRISVIYKHFAEIYTAVSRTDTVAYETIVRPKQRTPEEKGFFQEGLQKGAEFFGLSEGTETTRTPQVPETALTNPSDIEAELARSISTAKVINSVVISAEGKLDANQATKIWRINKSLRERIAKLPTNEFPKSAVTQSLDMQNWSDKANSVAARVFHITLQQSGYEVFRKRWIDRIRKLQEDATSSFDRACKACDGKNATYSHTWARDKIDASVLELKAIYRELDSARPEFLFGMSVMEAYDRLTFAKFQVFLAQRAAETLSNLTAEAETKIGELFNAVRSGQTETGSATLRTWTERRVEFPTGNLADYWADMASHSVGYLRALFDQATASIAHVVSTNAGEFLRCNEDQMFSSAVQLLNQIQPNGQVDQSVLRRIHGLWKSMALLGSNLIRDASEMVGEAVRKYSDQVTDQELVQLGATALGVEQQREKLNTMTLLARQRLRRPTSLKGQLAAGVVRSASRSPIYSMSAILLAFLDTHYGTVGGDAFRRMALEYVRGFASGRSWTTLVYVILEAFLIQFMVPWVIKNVSNVNDVVTRLTRMVVALMAIGRVNEGTPRLGVQGEWVAHLESLFGLALTPRFMHNTAEFISLFIGHVFVAGVSIVASTVEVDDVTVYERVKSYLSGTAPTVRQAETAIREIVMNLAFAVDPMADEFKRPRNRIVDVS